MFADEDVLFADADVAVAQEEAPWKVLVVDDEPEVHNITTMALKRFNFEGRRLEFLSAYSGREAVEMVERERDLAIILLDVVMETDDAGLRTVQEIRNRLGNRMVRIILRTGQPGKAPEDTVIQEYDIDDYASKGDLSAQKLRTSLITALRAYKEILRIEGIVQMRTSELAQRNQDILESINYAQRLQEAIIFDVYRIEDLVPKSFLFCRPKDILSGDFPFLLATESTLWLAAVDCTGHGIPGSILSVIGNFYLTEILKSNPNLNPEAALHQLHRRFLEIFALDGMDLALIKVDRHNRRLWYASAHRPILFYRGEEAQELKSGQWSIGNRTVGQGEIAFPETVIDLQPGDQFFLYSDGFQDQFGGPNGKRMGAKRFREIMDEVRRLPVAGQKERLRQELHDWQGDNKQTDDILVIGACFD